MPEEKPSRLRRPRHPMPAHIRAALLAEDLLAAYEARPPYQQNDYIGWITGAKLPATQEKRLRQMLEELADGTRYMKMAYHARPGSKASP